MSVQHHPGVARMRRRALIVRAVVVGALVLVLIGFALLQPRPEQGALRVTTVTGAVEPTGVLSGVLVAGRSGDAACYSVTSRGTVSVLRFVRGWSADEDLSLLDATGTVVAQPGRTLTVLGAPAGIGRVAGCAERGRIWTVTSLRPRSAG